MEHYEIRVNIELARVVNVIAKSREEAERKALKEVENSLNPPWAVDYSDELYRMEVE